MTPVWSPEAINDLVALRAYIEQDDPAAAQRVALHIVQNIETLLPSTPEMGRPGRVPGTRELVIPKTPFIGALPFGREHGPDSPYLPQCSSVARSTLKDTSLGPCAST